MSHVREVILSDTIGEYWCPRRLEEPYCQEPSGGDGDDAMMGLVMWWMRLVLMVRAGWWPVLAWRVRDGGQGSWMWVSMTWILMFGVCTLSAWLPAGGWWFDEEHSWLQHSLGPSDWETQGCARRFGGRACTGQDGDLWGPSRAGCYHVLCGPCYGPCSVMAVIPALAIYENFPKNFVM